MVLSVYNCLSEYFLVFVSKVSFFCKTLDFYTHGCFSSKIYAEELGLSVLGNFMIQRQNQNFECSADEKEIGGTEDPEIKWQKNIIPSSWCFIDRSVCLSVYLSSYPSNFRFAVVFPHNLNSSRRIFLQLEFCIVFTKGLTVLSGNSCRLPLWKR